MSSELIPFEGYMAAKMPTDQIVELIRENIGEAEVNRFVLPRFKMPSGPSKYFVGPDGEPPVDEIDCVILHIVSRRAYWAQGIESGGGGQPPDCASLDLKVGHGEPGGSCPRCAFAKFGSGKDGRGQACKEFRVLFGLRPNRVIPFSFSLPPTSLQAWMAYGMSLVDQGKPYRGVITRIGLQKEKSGGGVDFHKATFKNVGELDPDQLSQIKAMLAEFMPVFSESRIGDEDVGPVRGGASGGPAGGTLDVQDVEIDEAGGVVDPFADRK